MEVTVYVPRPGTPTAAIVAPGSAIVGIPAEQAPGHILIHYEGNLYGAENLRSYEGRLKSAHGRLMHRYPTIARGLVPEDYVIPVGTYDGHQFLPTDQARLDLWLAGQESVTM